MRISYVGGTVAQGYASWSSVLESVVASGEDEVEKRETAKLVRRLRVDVWPSERKDGREADGKRREEAAEAVEAAR